MRGYLCVGGDNDGNWVNVEEYPPTRDIRMNRCEPLTYDKNGYLNFVTERYRPQLFRENCSKYADDYNEYFIFVHQSVQDGDILRTLIDGYKGKTK
jgi:hypothetical protein